MPDQPIASRVAEEAVAGAMIRDEACIDDVLALVEPADFMSVVCRRVAEACVGLRLEHTPIDGASAFTWIRQNHPHDGIKADDIGELLMGTPTAANALYHAKAVAGYAARRRLLLDIGCLADRVKGSPDRSPAPLYELLSDAQAITVELERRTAGVREPTPLSALVVKAMDAIEDRVRNKRASGIQTGLQGLDDLIGGMRAGQMIVIGARPSCGKSAACGQVLLNAAADGYNSLLVSLEMDEEEIGERFLCWTGEVSMHFARKGAIEDVDVKRLMKAHKTISNRPGGLFVLRNHSMTPSQIEAAVRAAVRRQKVHLAAIDYAQLVTGANRRDQRHEQLADISRRLKILARECGIPILVLAQLNRGVADEKPTMAHLLGSGGFEQDADVVILLHRLKDEKIATGIRVDAIVDKNRNGPLGVAWLRYIGQHFAFSDYHPCQGGE